MGHRKEKDYEVAEVEQDVWTCDFCERDIESESDIHVFAIDPKVKFSSSKAGGGLVWLHKTEGKRAVEKRTSISSKMDGHICDECIRDTNLSTGERVRGTVVACLRKLRLR